MNQLYAQLVANLNVGNGWYLTSAPVITANSVEAVVPQVITRLRSAGWMAGTDW
ncbi:hypothetical protein ACFL5T_03475 [Gemmatimonadota bacterium]